MVLITRVTSASSGSTVGANTVTYIYDRTYGAPTTGQTVQVTGFIAHPEFNITSGVITSVLYGPTYSFDVVVYGFPINVSETLVGYGVASTLIDVNTLSGTPWADQGTTQERVGEPLLYQIIGRDYSPPLTSPRPITYTSSTGGDPSFYISSYTLIYFNYPVSHQQIGYSDDLQSYIFNGYITLNLPDLTNLAPTNDGVLRVGLMPGFYMDFRKDTNGFVQVSVSGSSTQTFSYTNGAYGSIDFNGTDNTGTTIHFNAYLILPGGGIQTLLESTTNWGYIPGHPLYLYAETLPGFAFINNASSMNIRIQNAGIQNSLNFYGNTTIITSDNNTSPNSTTITLAPPVLDGSSLLLPGWTTLNISGLPYKILDIYTNPIVVTFPQEVYGESDISITFDGGANYVNVGKVNEGDTFSYELQGQVITNNPPSTGKITIYCASSDNVGVETQIGYTGVTGTWLNNSSTVTISSSDLSSHVITPSHTYIVKDGYFQPNTIIQNVVPSPPNVTLYLTKPTVQAGTTLGFELRYFQRTVGINNAQFVMTGTSTSGYSGGTAMIKAYPSSIGFPIIPLNIFIDNTRSAYPLIAPYISGNGTPLVTLSAPSGLLTPQTFTTELSFYGVYDDGPVDSVFTNISVQPVTITLTPDPISPTFQLIRYQPFSYMYTIPSYNPDMILKLNAASSSLSSYVTISETGTTAYFASTIGSSNIFQSQPVIFDAVIFGNVVGTISNSTTIRDFSIQVNPSIPGYTIQLYKYESFSNSFAIASPTSLVLKTTGSSPEILTFLSPSTPTSNLLFSSSAGYQISYSSPLVLSVNATTPDNIIASNITVSVPVGPGRFYSPMSNTTYTFYVAENVSTTYPSVTDLRFSTYLELDLVPVSAPSLPSGLSFQTIDSNTFQLQGIPNVQSTRQNYRIIGSNTTNGKIVTTQVSIQVQSPRISLSGGPTVVSGMQVGIPIQSSTFTATIPTTAFGTSNFYYNWNSNLPDGLFFQDINGSNVASGVFSMFPPDSDTSKTIVIAGSPTSAAATAFVTAGLSNYTVTLTGNTRNPVLNSPAVTLQFSFGELVLFTGTTIPSLYATSPLSSNTLIFKASSYFPSTSPITSILATNLPPGLSLTTNGTPNYVNGVNYSSGVYVSGTPTVVNQTPTPTILTATNSHGKFQTSSVSIPILPDVVTFDSATPAQGAELVFIVSRPTFTDYPSGIKFTAISAAGKPITSISTTDPDITQYGLTLSSNGTLSGTPITDLSRSLVTFTAVDSLGTIGTRDVYITIKPDVYTFNSITLNLVQNKTITPVQIIASTLSERQVQYYRSANLPSGLFLSPTGLLTGTPLGSTAGTFDVIASTGYDTGTATYSYTMIPDSILTLLLVSPLKIPVGPFSVDAFRSITYSGFDAPTSYVSNSLFPTDIAINMDNDIMWGDITSGSGTYTFTVRGTYQNVTADTVVTLVIANGFGVFTIASSPSFTFTMPTQTTIRAFQYIPLQPVRLQATGGSGFVYYYSLANTLPRGLSLVPDPTGTYATIVGTPAIYSANGIPIVVYAKNGSFVTSIVLTFVITTPFFVESTTAAAYTALLRNTVEENAAHNSEDNKVFPQSDALRGPLLAPPAPDEVVDRTCKKC